MHQKSLDDVELWIWNSIENMAFKELNSFFLPSCVHLLPSKMAYSFIDRGRIRIKSLSKRAPRAIDIYEPIYNVIDMIWITDEQFYFIGKYKDHFKVFLCDISDRDVKIFSLTNVDDDFQYFYPCKINQFLFCIIKNDQDLYEICKLPWNPQKIIPDSLCCAIPEKCITIDKSPLCFLSMVNETTGFVLKLIDAHENNSLLHFACYHLQQNQDLSWSLCQLFEFQLPKNIIIGSEETRIYESIYPFLPTYGTEWIYFVTFQTELQKCIIRSYHRPTNTIETLVIKNLRHNEEINDFFAPCLLHKSIYCGISCSQISQDASLIESDPVTGFCQCRLPEVKI